MNFLILINSAPNYKYFFHEIAKELNKNGHNIYYAIDSHRSKYLEPLEEIDKNPNSYFFDVFLKENFQHNLKINSELYLDTYWGDCFYSDFDRYLTHNFNLNQNSNFWLNVKVNLDNFFYNLIEKLNIDYILYENVSNSFAYSAYIQANKLNKKYIGIMGSRLPNHFEIQTSIIEDELIKLKELSQFHPTEDELMWFENYKNTITDIQPDYMKQNGLDNVTLTRLINYNKFLKVINLATMGFKYNYHYDYQFGNPSKSILKGILVNLKRFINTKKSKKYYISNNELNNRMNQENFYVYPIHFHPESSTSILAPEYTNEYVNIINIANNLPFGTYLYVKDHKSAKGVQSHDFYKKISSLPYIRLVDYNVNIKELIKKSQGVITINSTAGYEAILLEKPVFIFGRVFYENFTNVVKLNHPKELKFRLTTFNLSKINPMDFISYKRYCFSGKINISDLSQAKNIAIQIENFIKGKGLN